MNGLPPFADADDVEHVWQACRCGRAYVRRGLTERYLDQVWKIPRIRLGVAVAEHVELKRKTFTKLDVDGRRLDGKMQANVTLVDSLDVLSKLN